MKTSFAVITVLFICLVFCGVSTYAQGPPFTYQGKLTDGGNPANAQYDFIFKLFDSSGTQIGSDVPKDDVQVTGGVFTVTLDFGTSPFAGATAASLEIAVRPGASTGAYTTLTPRQPITSDPYAIRSSSAANADIAANSTQLGGLTAAQYVVTTDPRMTDARIPIPGNANYIQNGTATQASSNFNISGNGTVGGTLTSSKLGVGVSSPLFSLHVIDPSNTGLRVQTNATGGTVASFGGNGDFVVDAPGVFGGRLWVTEAGDTFIGANTAGKNLVVNGKIFGDGSGLTNVGAARTTNSLSLLGSLRWDLLAQKTFGVGTSPFGIAFDGANIWVTSGVSNNVSKLRASDGAILGTFAVGAFPIRAAFDGTNIWVTNDSANTVTKLRASDGVTLGTFAVGANPVGIAFDGTNVWVVNSNGNSLSKLRASDGALQATVLGVGNSPSDVAFDGTNLWVTSTNGSGVIKLRPSDGATLGTFVVGSFPHGVAFDGLNVWVANAGSNNVMKLRASDGANLGTFAVATGPIGVAFDGSDIWVVSNAARTVTKLHASDGANLGSFPVGDTPQTIAFDGADIWVVNQGSNNVTKIPAFP